MNLMEDYDFIGCECESFDESLVYAECAYSNILLQSVKEHKEYLNEGIASKFLDSIKNFFSKMSSWIRARCKDLKVFTNKTLIKMKKIFGLISEFAIKYEDRIIEGAKTNEAIANTLNWYPSLLKLGDLEKELFKLKFSDEFNSIIEDTKNFVNSHFKSNDIVETKVDLKTAKIAVSNAKICPNIEKVIKAYVSLAEEALKETEEASEAGIKNKKDEQAVIQSKNKVEEGKKKILTTSKKCSILINLANKCIIDSHRINVACAKMYTGK